MFYLNYQTKKEGFLRFTTKHYKNVNGSKHRLQPSNNNFNDCPMANSSARKMTTVSNGTKVTDISKPIFPKSSELSLNNLQSRNIYLLIWKIFFTNKELSTFI